MVRFLFLINVFTATVVFRNFKVVSGTMVINKFRQHKEKECHGSLPLSIADVKAALSRLPEARFFETRL